MSPKKKDETHDSFTNQALEAVTAKLRNIETHIETLQNQNSKVESSPYIIERQNTDLPTQSVNTNGTHDRLQELEVKLNELLMQNNKSIKGPATHTPDPDWDDFKKVNCISLLRS